MENNNLIINGFWYGSALTQVEKLCINSFLANGHEFNLYTYDLALKNVPLGCVIKDANEIIDESEVFMDSRGIIASFSDYFRVRLLYTRGGWWVDMDVICLKPFTIGTEYCFSSEYVNGGIHPNIGCIKVPKETNLMADYLRAIEVSLGEGREVKWGAFGPRLMRELLRYYDSGDFITAPEIFIQPPLITGPSKELQFEKIFLPYSESEIKCGLTGYSIHLYNELWRLFNIEKSQPFPKGSVLDYLKSKYC